MIRSDYLKYRKYGGNLITIILLTQGFWAILQFRIASYIYRNIKLIGLRHFLLFICLIWQKLIEVTTGISLPASVIIGKSFYIGHFGNIIIHPKSVIGNNCNISQGVTIGISGRGNYRGVPKLGNNVYIGCNATVVGNITIGSDCVIGANSLVNRDVPKGKTVLGVPAQVISDNDSSLFI